MTFFDLPLNLDANVLGLQTNPSQVNISVSAEPREIIAHINVVQIQ